jgi:hypothetical protein
MSKTVQETILLDDRVITHVFIEIHPEENTGINYTKETVNLLVGEESILTITDKYGITEKIIEDAKVLSERPTRYKK